MNLDFWQILVLFSAPCVISLLSVLLGGWLVFRTKNAQLGIPMVQSKPKKDNGTDRYIDPEEFGIFDDLDKGLSPAARRLKAQKGLDPLKVAKGEAA